VLVRDHLIMAYGYRPVDRDQPFLLPPDLRDWDALFGDGRGEELPAELATR
jgi:hypothetical protein